MHVILSQPTPPTNCVTFKYTKLPVYTQSGDIISFKRSSIISFKLFPSLILPYTNSTISSLLLVSHIPSHPITMKSSSFYISKTKTSGLDVIAYSSGFRFSFCLNFKSPSDLLKFKLPSTLPSVIVLPALCIHSLSMGLSGLWSKESATAYPFLASTERESPALATVSKLFAQSKRRTLAVQPTDSKVKSSSELVVSPRILTRGGFVEG